ncbi:MAG: hypothetical protein ACLR8Y_10095 [Alistipes indistinctus]
MTEVREKSLPSISLFRFDTEGSLTVRRKSESGTILATTTTASWSRRPGLIGQDVNTTITVAD